MLREFIISPENGMPRSFFKVLLITNHGMFALMRIRFDWINQRSEVRIYQAMVVFCLISDNVGSL